MPDPLLVILFAVVGLGLVPQHTPFTVTVAPPFELIIPPLLALDDVITLAASVLPSTGTVIVGVGGDEFGESDLLHPPKIKGEITTAKSNLIFIIFFLGLDITLLLTTLM